MQNLQVRRRRLYRFGAASLSPHCNNAQFRLKGANDGRDWQLDVEINILLMIEGNQFTVPRRVFLGRSVAFAMPVTAAAAFRASPHEVLFA